MGYTKGDFASIPTVFMGINYLKKQVEIPSFWGYFVYYFELYC